MQKFIDPQYATPELLSDEICGPFSDLWALGIIACELFFGQNPFIGDSEEEILDRIKNGKPRLPEDLDKDAKSFICCLLQMNPVKRLGNTAAHWQASMQELKGHALFKEYEWPPKASSDFWFTKSEEYQ